MTFAFVCDFDGTVSPHDIGEGIERRFSTLAPEAHAALLAEWLCGDLGHRALTERLCEGLVVEGDEALAFTRRFAIDPAFAEFVREAEAAGDRVMVASEGFEFYIRDQLARAGLERLPVAANRARFEARRLIPEFPHAGRGCGRCGNCKAVHVEALRAAGRTVVFVGDGLSDRCGARAADRVLARGALLAWCRETGVHARPFEHFGDVAAAARAWRASNGAPAGAEA